jgi:hypothetical protein
MLKKIYQLSILAALVGISACKKDNEIVTPALAEFADAVNLNVGKYFITSDPNTVFEVPVGITSVSNVDRTIEFTVSSSTGAVEGSQYTLSGNSIVIPAGTALAKIPVKGIFAGYPTGRKDTLTLTLSGGSVDIWSKYNTYKIVMQKYCDIVLDDLDGTFTNTRETNSAGGSPYGPYNSGVTLTPIGGSTTKANIVFHNFWDYGIDVTGTIDWTDPTNFKVVIPRQATGLEYDTDQPIDVRSSPGQVSTFSSCDQSYSLTVDFIVKNYDNSGSDAYYSQNYKITIKR